MQKQTDEQRKEKKRAAQAAWRAANKEHIKAYNAAYAAKQLSLGRSEYHKDLYEKNRKARIEAVKKWQSENKERDLENKAKWRAKNKHRYSRYASTWAAKNPEAARLIKQTRRARIRNAEGMLSKDLITHLYRLQKGKCPCCAKPLGDDYHLDHKMPLALGGTNTDDNMQLLRKSCNLQKHAKHPVDFMQSRGFLL